MKRWNQILVGALTMLVMTLTSASTPLWTFKPLTATTLSLSANSTATIRYQMTNQSRKSHTLVMTAIPGITQVKTAGNCPSPFKLTYQQSCILTLEVNGGSLSDNIIGGPVVCEEGNPLQCYRPSQAHSLNITKEAIPSHSVGGTVTGLNGTVTLLNNGANPTPISMDGPFAFSTSIIEGGTYAVTIETQPFEQICSVVNGSGTVGAANVTNVAVTCASNNTTLSVGLGTIPVNSGISTFTVTNTGTINPAYNVHAVLPSSWNGVTQDASNCTMIAPNHGTCVLRFSSTTPYIAQGNIVITGDNIGSPPTTAFAFTATTNNYLIWQIAGTTVWVIDTTNLPQQLWTTTDASATGALSLTDGVGNTATIIAAQGATGTPYAAQSCNNSTNGGASVGTWYLPAICETGSVAQGAGCPSGLPNIFTNLTQFFFGGLIGLESWSSTEQASPNQMFAWTQVFGAGPVAAQQLTFNKVAAQNQVRCVRSLTI